MELHSKFAEKNEAKWNIVQNGLKPTWIHPKLHSINVMSGCMAQLGFAKIINQMSASIETDSKQVTLQKHPSSSSSNFSKAKIMDHYPIRFQQVKIPDSAVPNHIIQLSQIHLG